MNIRIGSAALLGALASLAAAPANAADTTYGYDVHGQLVSVSRTAGSATYAYDKAGNRTQITAGAGSTPSATSSQAGVKNAGAATDGPPAGFVLPQLLPDNAAALSPANAKAVDR